MPCRNALRLLNDLQRQAILRLPLAVRYILFCIVIALAIAWGYYSSFIGDQ